MRTFGDAGGVKVTFLWEGAPQMTLAAGEDLGLEPLTVGKKMVQAPVGRSTLICGSGFGHLNRPAVSNDLMTPCSQLISCTPTIQQQVWQIRVAKPRWVAAGPKLHPWISITHSPSGEM